MHFKNHKTTILLYVDPQGSFSTIKADLLSAIKQASGLESLDARNIPSDPEDVEFALPVSRHDPHRGWVTLEIPEDEAKKTKILKGGHSAVNDSPMGAGLKDGMNLAFRFRTEEERKRTKEDVEDEPGAGEMGWDVIVPAYDDE